MTAFPNHIDEEHDTEIQESCLTDDRPSEINCISLKSKLTASARYVRNHKIVFTVIFSLVLTIIVLAAKSKTNYPCEEDESTNYKVAHNSQKGNPKNADTILTIPSKCQIPIRPPSNKTVGITCRDITLDIFTKDNVNYINCRKLKTYSELEKDTFCNGSQVTCCHMAHLCHKDKLCHGGMCACMTTNTRPVCAVLIECDCAQSENTEKQLGETNIPNCQDVVFGDENQLICHEYIGQYSCVCNNTIDVTTDNLTSCYS